MNQITVRYFNRGRGNPDRPQPGEGPLQKRLSIAPTFHQGHSGLRVPTLLQSESHSALLSNSFLGLFEGSLGFILNVDLVPITR